MLQFGMISSILKPIFHKLSITSKKLLITLDKPMAFWPFSGAFPYVATTIAVCGISYYGYGIYIESKFNNPIVQESIKILNQNKRMKQIIGYPIGYKASTSSQYKETETENYYTFKAVGPRGTTEVEVTAINKPTREVFGLGKQIQPKQQQSKSAQPKSEDIALSKSTLEPQEQNPAYKARQLERKIQQLRAKAVQSKGGFFGGKSKEQLQLELLQNEYSALRQKVIEQICEYYIPETEYYSEITKLKGSNEDNILPEQSKLYKISNMACELPNKNRINIINSKKPYLNRGVERNSSQTANSQEKPEQRQNSTIPLPTYRYLSERVSLEKMIKNNGVNMSEEEIEQLSKHKTSFMYQRFSQYSVMSFLCMTFFAGAVFVYKKKSQLQDMTNSVMYNLVERKFYNRSEIKALNRKILQEKKKNPHLSESIQEIRLARKVAGGMRYKKFDCCIHVKGLTNGRLHVKGKHDTKNNHYSFDEFYLTYHEGSNESGTNKGEFGNLGLNTEKRIDLLN